MAQSSSLPKLVIGGVAIGAIAFLMTGSPETPRKKAESSKPRAASRAKAEDEFTKADYEAKFAPTKLAVRDVFSPLVLASSGGRGGSIAPNAIPFDFTGSKEAWVYTGTAVINGVPNALVENTSTGEGEFIKVGQTWKLATVRRITPTSLTLTNSSGRVQTMDLMRDLELDDRSLMSAQVQPVAPQGRGDSGRSGSFGMPGGGSFGMPGGGSFGMPGGGVPGQATPLPGGGVAIPLPGGGGAIAMPSMRGSIGSPSGPTFDPVTSSDNDPAGLGGISDPAATVGEP